jgi:hypothetical protein
MEKTEFIEKNIFLNLDNLNDGFEADSKGYFSESDFEIVLERIEKLGIGIYGIEPRFEGNSIDIKINEDFSKKATDAKWYKKAFSEFKKKQPNLQYSATYKVSDKLLSKSNTVNNNKELS